MVTKVNIFFLCQPNVFILRFIEALTANGIPRHSYLTITYPLTISSIGPKLQWQIIPNPPPAIQNVIRQRKDSKLAQHTQPSVSLPIPSPYSLRCTVTPLFFSTPFLAFCFILSHLLVALSVKEFTQLHVKSRSGISLLRALSSALVSSLVSLLQILLSQPRLQKPSSVIVCVRKASLSPSSLSGFSKVSARMPEWERAVCVGY